MRRFLAPAALALLALAPPTFAQQAGAARFREMFLQLDGDGDGVIERDEVPEAGRDAFDRLLKRGDADKDGKLQAAEMKALAAKLRALGDLGTPADRIKGFDEDGDGKVSREEFPGPAMGFDRLDVDKDGFISAEEAAKAPAPARAKAEEKPEPNAPAATAEPAKSETPKAKAKAKPAGPGAAARRFKVLDKDGDGKLSREEFPREKLFGRLDADKDGFLSPAEMAEAARLKP